MVSYLALAAFTVVACLMAVSALLLNLWIAPSQPSAAKSASYECGFPPLSDSSMPFDTRYYLVALLFILFDIDMAFLLPWALVVRDVGIQGWCVMMVFLGIIVLGVYAEWRAGALQWI